MLLLGTACSDSAEEVASATQSGQAAARQIVANFLEARVTGTGAERYLGKDAEEEFNAKWGKTHLGLHPLYAASGTSYESFSIVFVERLSKTSYEVGYRIKGSPRPFAETLFVTGEDQLRIVGGRLGLVGP
ncbi:MAG: hypothetical protein M3312_05000 [Actinomycetota bacterium]|nr:hypothetical protein [Actinomycetota bacterium]